MLHFINPNYHVIMIHAPLGLLSVGILVELFSFLWRGSTFRTAGRWMLLLGALATAPTATSGLYALANTVTHGDESPSWLEAKQSSGFDNQQWSMIRNHVLFNAIGSAVAIAAAVTWLGSSDFWRRRLQFLLLLVMIGAIALFTIGAWNGGEMVYGPDGGLAVRHEWPDARSAPRGPPHSDNPTRDRRDKIEYYVSPMDVHTLMAGLVVALSAGALGLTIRGMTHTPDVLIQRTSSDAAAGEMMAQDSVGGDQPRAVAALRDPYAPDEATLVSELPPRVPSSRWWLLGALAALLTVAGGLYVGNILTTERFVKVLQRTAGEHSIRMQFHVVFALSIVLLTIILAVMTRVAPRNRAVLGVFSLLLVLALAAQVWIGILMLYDSPDGSSFRNLTRFQTQTDVAQRDAARESAKGD